VIPQLNIYGEIIRFDGLEIIRSAAGDWEGLTIASDIKAQFAIKIGDEKISEQFILAYAVAFQLIMAGEMPVLAAPVASVDALRQEELLVRKFNTIGVTALGALFLILIINFFIFQHYTKANEQLAFQIGQRDRDLTSEADIETKIRRAEVLLDSLGYTGGQDHARMVDEMAKLLPGEVTWEKVSISPTRRAVGNESSSVFINREIQVSGRSDKIIAINEWVARLQTLRWAKKVRLSGFRFNNELRTGQYDVVIEY
jgi:Tfp pilus assembly protein PilN